MLKYLSLLVLLCVLTSAAQAGSITLSISTSAGTATVAGTISDADATRLIASYQTVGLTSTQVLQTLIGPSVLSFLKSHVMDFERQAAISATPTPITLTAGQ
jgi:hypothetical protein